MTDKSVILVDANNIGFAAQHAGKARLMAGDIDTTGAYNFLRMIHVIRRDFGGKMILLWDGLSWRHQAALAEGVVYKDKRDITPEQKAGREGWKQTRALLTPILRALGLDQMVAGNLEADDLAARLRRNPNWQNVLLVSSDADWLTLIDDRTQVYDHRKERRVTMDNFKEMVGLNYPRQLVEKKALTGDTSDNIPPIGGIGDKTATELLLAYNTVQSFYNACITDAEARAAAPRRALSLLDDVSRQDHFRSNLRLIDLDHPESPKALNITNVKGVFDPDLVRAKCEELAFTSITRDLGKWLAPFRPV